MGTMLEKSNMSMNCDLMLVFENDRIIHRNYHTSPGGIQAADGLYIIRRTCRTGPEERRMIWYIVTDSEKNYHQYAGAFCQHKLVLNRLSGDTCLT